MKKYIYLAVLVITVGFSSCSDFLEETNPNEIRAELFWSDLEESENSITSIYAGMLDQFVLDIEREFYRTDMAFPGPSGRPIGLWLPWYQQILTSDETALNRRWESQYRVIWRANQAIEGLNGMSDALKSNDRWVEQMGQARFFRGLMHFYLHSVYNNGEIVIRDFFPKQPSDRNKALSSSEEVITFFRDDLKYAFDNLPAQFSDKSRVDRATAATILGTSHLYEGEYADASFYFNEVITNPDYGLQLEQNLDNIFTNTGDFNSESIFEINYTLNQQIEDGNFDETSFFHRLSRRIAPQQRNLITRETFGGEGNLRPSAWITYAYSTEPMDTQDSRNYIDGDVTGTLRSISLRASQSIAVVNDEVSSFYGSTAPQVYGFAGNRFSLYKKYTNHDIVTSEFNVGGSPWKSGRNIVVNRLSGVYLMQAESLVQQGDIDGAIDLINEIRMRWGLQLIGLPDGSPHDFDGIAYANTTLMDHLMFTEYPLELSIEGHCTRFIDLRRWGITAQRFLDLSNDRYSLSNYMYTRPNGRPGTRRASLLEKDPSGNIVEYDVPADSWAASDLGYLRIPQNETLNNNKVN